jgi:DNA-binding MarR family transcriptional regulator
MILSRLSRGEGGMAKSVLQEEIRKKNPFDCLEVEASLNLLRTVDFLHHSMHQLFHEHDVSPPQYNVLRILRGHGGLGLPCCEISAQMITRMPDITRLVDRLEEAGLVARTRCSDDRRVVRVSITDAGLKLLARLDRPTVEMHRRILGHLTAAELTELNRLLVKIRRPDG